MNHFYKNRHQTEEGRQATLKFLELERKLDEENATTIEYMNRDHLNKTKSKQVDAAVRRWSKEHKSLVKKIKSDNLNSLGSDRNWIMV